MVFCRGMIRESCESPEGPVPPYLRCHQLRLLLTTGTEKPPRSKNSAGEPAHRWVQTNGEDGGQDGQERTLWQGQNWLEFRIVSLSLELTVASVVRCNCWISQHWLAVQSSRMTFRLSWRDNYIWPSSSVHTLLMEVMQQMHTVQMLHPVLRQIINFWQDSVPEHVCLCVSVSVSLCLCVCVWVRSQF